MNATKKLALTVIAGSALAMSNSTMAGSANANLGATASVPQVCTISAATLAVGTYDPIVTNASADKTGSTTFNIKCTNGSTTVTIGMGQGANYQSGSSSRALVDPGVSDSFLLYGLYQSTGTSSPWDDSANVYTVQAADLNGTTRPITVYYVAPAAQTVKYGTAYADTVAMTINF